MRLRFCIVFCTFLHLLMRMDSAYAGSSVRDIDNQISSFICEMNAHEDIVAQSLACKIQNLRKVYGEKVGEQAIEQYLQSEFQLANQRAVAVKEMGGSSKHADETARIIGGMLLTQRAYMRTQS